MQTLIRSQSHIGLEIATKLPDMALSVIFNYRCIVEVLLCPRARQHAITAHHHHPTHAPTNRHVQGRRS